MFDVGMAVGFGVQAAKKHISDIRGGLQVHFHLGHAFVSFWFGGVESIALNLEGICEKLDRKLQPAPALTLDGYAIQG